MLAQQRVVQSFAMAYNYKPEVFLPLYCHLRSTKLWLHQTKDPHTTRWIFFVTKFGLHPFLFLLHTLNAYIFSNTYLAFITKNYFSPLIFNSPLSFFSETTTKLFISVYTFNCYFLLTISVSWIYVLQPILSYILQVFLLNLTAILLKSAQWLTFIKPCNLRYLRLSISRGDISAFLHLNGFNCTVKRWPWLVRLLCFICIF